MATLLQGSSTNLQGTMPSLQGNTTTLQGSSLTQPTVPKKQQVAAIKPIQQNDLSALYGLNNGTVYNKTTNAAFSKPEEFFKESGVNSFDNVKFDTLYKPQQAGAPAAMPPPTVPAVDKDSGTSANDTYAKQLKTLQDKVLSSYDSTPEELAALNEVTNKKNEIANFEGSANLGINNLEGQGRGIPLQIVRGQQGKLLKQSLIQDQTLQQQLANLQAKQDALRGNRENSFNRAKTELGFAQGEAPTEVSAGSSLVRLNPQTGKYENQFTAPSAEKAPTLPASAQEYQYAVNQGYKGSYQDYQNEDANRKAVRSSTTIIQQGDKLLTPTEAASLGVPYGTTREQAFGQTPKGTDAQNSAATYGVRTQQSGEILNQLEKSIQGMNALSFETQSRLPSYLQSNDFQSFDQAARNFINATLRRESGAVISPTEFANAYQQYLPRPGDSAQTLAQKKQNRETVTNGLVNSGGIGYTNLTGGSSSSTDYGAKYGF